MLQIVAGIAPDRFVRVKRLDIFDKGQQLALVLRLKRLSAQQRQAVDVAGCQTFKDLVANLLGEGRTIAKVPSHCIEAVGAVAAAARYKQAGAHALAVGNVTIFDRSVIHSGSPAGHPCPALYSVTQYLVCIGAYYPKTSTSIPVYPVQFKRDFRRAISILCDTSLCRVESTKIAKIYA